MKQWVNFFLLILVIGSSFCDLFSQNIQTKPTRQSSFEAFSKGNYEQAYIEFKELLLVYTKDPLYKYYSGVCLVKLSKDPGEAITLLQQALNSASVVKTLPSDALFYLGKAQQMSGRFTEAVVSYNLYTEQVGKKTAREQGVPELIQQCDKNFGQIKEPLVKPDEIINNEEVNNSKIENKAVVKEANLQPVEKGAYARKNLQAGHEKILDEALEFQFKADSLNALIADQKKELEKLTNAEQTSLKVNISENLLLASSFQKLADQKFSDAQVVMNPQQEKIQQIKAIQPSDNKVIKDSVEKADNRITKETDKQLDTIKKIVPEVKKPVETFTYFEVLTKSVSDPNAKITIDGEVPPGLIYRIQLAVFRNPVAHEYFKGMTPVYGFKDTGTGRTKYYAGMFRRLSDAKKALTAVKAKGFKDAFIVAFSGNKTVSADRAAVMEKEWGKKPFVNRMEYGPASPIDTIPPTLSFRVEVIRTLKPLNDEMLEGVEKVAGNRGLDIQTLYDGNIVYLIGKFITFDSADEYADLLIRNGYREARVVAWLGKKEISVDIAKQLFENLE